MILDVHTHICPPEIRAGRAAFFHGEDDFRLLYENPNARLVGATNLAAYLDDQGIDGACAFGFPWNDDGHTRLCNEYALDAGTRYPNRILPFACVNPLRGSSAVSEAERCLSAGARGLGEIATYGAGLGPAVREALAPLAGLAAEAGVPILLHTNEPVGHMYPGKSHMEVSEIYALVAAHPDTKWILAHWGGGLFAYHLLKKQVDDVLANVWYDTAAGPYLYKPETYRRFLDLAGPGKLLFGSDYPLLPLARYRKDAETAGLTPGEMVAVFGDTLAELLGWEPSP